MKPQYPTYENQFPSLCKWKGLVSEFTQERYIPVEKIMQCCVDKQRLNEVMALAACGKVSEETRKVYEIIIRELNL